MIRKLFLTILVLIALVSCAIPPQDLPRLYKKNINTVVFIQVDKFDTYTQERTISIIGSGFIVDKSNGLIITAAHVVEGREIFRVALYSEIVIGAELIAVDSVYDLALLKVDPRFIDYSVQPLRLELNPTIGEYVFSIGAPNANIGTMSLGILSRSLIFIDFFNTEVYLSDLHIYDGNSGCPVFNLKNKIIGMIVGYIGYGAYSAIVPASSIEKFLNDNN